MKPKQLLRETRKKAKAKKTPESTDEYLEAGVDFEEAGEKWRGGDAQKALRFFGRAIDTYEEGLRKYPQSFDLAYNKARLQFALTQHPKLAPLVEPQLIRAALESHRYALTLQQENADLFLYVLVQTPANVSNTAQVLVTVAEADESPQLLEEAIELLQRCLAMQELQLEQATEASAEAIDEQADEPADEPMSLDEPEADQWAMIVEPVTHSTLLDTAIAQIEALAAFTSSGKGLEWIEEYTRGLLQKASVYAASSSREADLTLPRAQFVAALADSSFREHKISLQTYALELQSAFTDVEGLPKADALLAFAQTGAISTDEPSKKLQWDALVQVLEILKLAAGANDSSTSHKINISLAETELLRRRLAEHPPLAQAVRSSAVLLKNAEVYYRGARKWAEATGDAAGAQSAARREALVQALVADTAVDRDTAASMVDEGLLPPEILLK